MRGECDSYMYVYILCAYMHNTFALFRHKDNTRFVTTAHNRNTIRVHVDNPSTILPRSTLIFTHKTLQQRRLHRCTPQCSFSHPTRLDCQQTRAIMFPNFYNACQVARDYCHLLGHSLLLFLIRMRVLVRHDTIITIFPCTCHYPELVPLVLNRHTIVMAAPWQWRHSTHPPPMHSSRTTSTIHPR